MKPVQLIKPYVPLGTGTFENCLSLHVDRPQIMLAKKSSPHIVTQVLIQIGLGSFTTNTQNMTIYTPDYRPTSTRKP